MPLLHCTRANATKFQVYCEFDRFAGYFQGLSTCLSAVLKQSDAVLGLALKDDPSSSTRPRLNALLKEFAKDMNDFLPTFDEFKVSLCFLMIS